MQSLHQTFNFEKRPNFTIKSAFPNFIIQCHRLNNRRHLRMVDPERPPRRARSSVSYTEVSITGKHRNGYANHVDRVAKETLLAEGWVESHVSLSLRRHDNDVGNARSWLEKKHPLSNSVANESESCHEEPAMPNLPTSSSSLLATTVGADDTMVPGLFTIISRPRHNQIVTENQNNVVVGAARDLGDELDVCDQGLISKIVNLFKSLTSIQSSRFRSQ